MQLKLNQLCAVNFIAPNLPSTIRTGVKIDVNYQSYPAGLQLIYTNAAMRTTALFVGLSENPIF